uniref:WAP domain-containing protein n=1 Tax=Sinocyclocheilus anshuiensis TaxID=1608454 RepID=A0A671K124_9TELE
MLIEYLLLWSVSFDLLSLSCVCLTEKPGVCPSKNLGEEGLCVEMCSHDSNCPNDQKCCSNGCGHQCMHSWTCNLPNCNS